jgi:hypothetical protein
MDETKTKLIKAPLFFIGERVDCCFIDETLFSAGSSILSLQLPEPTRNLLKMDVLIGQVLDWNRGMDSECGGDWESVDTGCVNTGGCWYWCRYWMCGYYHTITILPENLPHSIIHCQF